MLLPFLAFAAYLDSLILNDFSKKIHKKLEKGMILTIYLPFVYTITKADGAIFAYQKRLFARLIFMVNQITTVRNNTTSAFITYGSWMIL